MASQAAFSGSWVPCSAPLRSSIAVWKEGAGARREGARGGNTAVMIGAADAASAGESTGCPLRRPRATPARRHALPGFRTRT